ncbi:tetratricopeptide repeat protein [bacterium]|nr:tetratricopeptide repeat protein [bacterium]
MIRSKKFLQNILLILAAGLTYVNIVNNKFVFDDVSTVKKNKIITSLRNLNYLFSENYFKPSGVADFTVSGEASYRPVVTFSYFLDCFFWKKNHIGYHLTNFLLHIMVVIVFFLAFSALFKNRIVVFTASLLYAVHPVLTEAVNCISFREDLLCALFFWLALYLHLTNRPARIKKIFLICLFFLLSVFSKEMGIVFLPAIIIIDYFTAENRLTLSAKKFFRKYFFLFSTVLFYLLIRFFVMKNPYAPPLDYPYKSFFQNAGAMLEIFAHYVQILFYPVNLTVDYTAYFPNIFILKRGLVWAVLLAGLLSVSFFTVFSGRRKNDMPITSVCVILFFLSLMPVSNIIPIKNIIAERYLYLPFGFFSLFFSNLFFSKIYYSGYKKVKFFCLLIITVLYISLTLYSNYSWSNGYLLWKKTLKVNRLSFHAHNNLAGICFDRKMYEAAKYHYSQAIYIRPYDAIPYYNLANTYSAQGNYAEAIDNYKRAARRDSSLIEPYVNLAITYSTIGELDKAESALREALRINNNDSSTHNNLGVVLSKKGLLDQAIREHIIAIKLNQNNKNAYKNLALCFFDKKEYKKAVKVFNKLIALQPDNDYAFFMMGQSFEFLKNNDNARKCYKRALSINPHNKSALERFKYLVNP